MENKLTREYRLSMKDAESQHAREIKALENQLHTIREDARTAFARAADACTARDDALVQSKKREKQARVWKERAEHQRERIKHLREQQQLPNGAHQPQDRTVAKGY